MDFYKKSLLILLLFAALAMTQVKYAAAQLQPPNVTLNTTSSTTLSTTILTTSSTTSTSTTSLTTSTSTSTSSTSIISTSTSTTSTSSTTTIAVSQASVSVEVIANDQLSDSVMYGTNPVTIRASINAGTPPYNFEWTLNGSVISGAVDNGNISLLTLPLPSAGNYTFGVNATANGVTLGTTFNTLVVFKNDTLSQTDNVPGGLPYGQEVSIEFNGTPTIKNQVPWTLFINGQLVGTTSANAIWNSAIPADVGIYGVVFSNAGNNNYTPYTYSNEFDIESPANTTTIAGTTTSTTVTTTSTSIENSSTTIAANTTVTSNTTTIIPAADILANYSYNVNQNTPAIVYLPKANTTVYISAITATTVHITAVNLTDTVAAFPGYKPILVLNLSINSSTKQISSAMVMSYPCSIQSNTVEAYILIGKTWTQVSNATLDQSACTISMGIPKDPIVGIFQYDGSSLTTSPKVPPSTTTIAPAQPSGNFTFDGLSIKVPQIPTTYIQEGIIVFVIAMLAVLIYKVREG